MVKQVSIGMLAEETKIYDEYVEIPVEVQGEEHIIKLYPFFSPESVRNMVNSLTEFYQNAAKEKLTVPSSEDDDLVGFFMIKHFTNLKLSNTEKAKTLYKNFKTVLNSKLFKVLLQSFPPESISNVYARISEVIEAGAKIQTMVTKMQKQIQELPLENKDILLPDAEKQSLN